MEYKEFRKRIEKTHSDSIILELLDEFIGKQEEKVDSENIKELIAQIKEQEIEEKTQAEEYLNFQINLTFCQLFYCGSLAAHPNFEDDALYFSNYMFHSYKEYKQLKQDYDYLINNRDIDIEKLTELLDFMYKYYGDSLDKIKKHYNIKKCGNISTNSKVYKLLLSGAYVYKNYKMPVSEAYEWFDYTVFTLHYVKAVEKFLVYKLNKQNLLNNKENETITMHKIIEKIKQNKEQLFKPEVPHFVEEAYFKLLSKFKDEYRNGYLHREKLILNKALFINDMIINILVITDVIFI